MIYATTWIKLEDLGHEFIDDGKFVAKVCKNCGKFDDGVIAEVLTEDVEKFKQDYSCEAQMLLNII